MSVIIGVAIFVGFLLNLISIVAEIFGRRTSRGVNEPPAVRWRRILLHLAVWVLIIGTFWGIVYFGPLRPVHEWIR